MEQSSKSPELKAFDLIRRAAYEYNKAEYKFYERGFFKFVRDGNKSFLIEDIYIHPEFRGTPVSSIILSEFETYMKEEGIIMYYGRVFKGSPDYYKRLMTFKKWGMVESNATEYYTTVSKQVEYYNE